MAEQFAIGVPNPLVSGHSFQNEAHVRANDTITGAPRYELLSESRPTFFNVSWNLSQDQFNAFEGWFKYGITFGSKPFDLDLFVGAGLVSHECYFQNGTYTSNLVGRRWNVTATLLVVEKQYTDESFYDDLSLLLSLLVNSNELQPFYSKLVNFGEVILPSYWGALKYGTDFS